MYIKILDSWLREYLLTGATPDDIQKYVSLCGPSVEKINKIKDDYIYDIEITTNRIDTVSVLGIAREAAAILPRFGIKAVFKNIQTAEPAQHTNRLPLSIRDPNFLCDRLIGIVMDGVKIGPSTSLIGNRLEKSGIRALNNVIDITNYVMLELGHPLHVFDYDRIKTSKLLIRYAKEGEYLTTLDDKKCLLDKKDIIIDDGNGRIIDLPGIMGTKNSVVAEKTKRIVVFVESNDPTAIRKTSLRLDLRTQAATINEKHPSPNLAKTAILRAIQLYQDHTNARISSPLIDIYPKPVQPTQIDVSIDFISWRIGIKIPTADIIKILISLGFKVVKKADNLNITPPSFRQFDILLKEDIVEEVARIWGYHKLPSNLMSGPLPTAYQSDDLAIEDEIKTMLKYWGFIETYSYSFISHDLITKSGLDSNTHLRIDNPLTEDFEYMRISLIPSLLHNISLNQHQRNNFNLFELAKIYLPQKPSLPKEISMLVFSGQDYYRQKGVIETILPQFGIKNWVMSSSNSSFWHPKQTLSLVVNNQKLATVGALHPKLKQAFRLKHDWYLAELDIDILIKLADFKKQYNPPSAYPPVYENLALIIPKSVGLGLLIEDIRNLSPLISNISFLDRFNNLTTLKITYQRNDRNLTAREVREVRNTILSHLQSKFNARLKTL